MNHSVKSSQEGVHNIVLTPSLIIHSSYKCQACWLLRDIAITTYYSNINLLAYPFTATSYGFNLHTKVIHDIDHTKHYVLAIWSQTLKDWSSFPLVDLVLKTAYCLRALNQTDKMIPRSCSSKNRQCSSSFKPQRIEAPRSGMKRCLVCSSRVAQVLLQLPPFLSHLEWLQAKMTASRSHSLYWYLSHNNMSQQSSVSRFVTYLQCEYESARQFSWSACLRNTVDVYGICTST